MQYIKELQFYNIYTQKDDTYHLTWNFFDGFQNLEQVRMALLAAGQNPENFIFVKHHGFLYAVAAFLMEQALVFSQDYVWYREPSSEVFRRIPRDSYTQLPYVINRVKSFHYYKIAMCQDLSNFDPGMRIIPGLNVKNVDKIYKNFCVATLGAVMINGLIPSYQLCCMDIYFQDITPFLQVWELGIKGYNPFNGAREIAPYTMETYLKDTNTAEEDLKDFAYIRNTLLNMGVMMDASLGETLKLPFHFGRKLVYALNMLLSDLGDKTVKTSNSLDAMPLDTILSDLSTNANAVLAEKSLHFCRMCHTSLPSDAIDNICPICKEQELFLAVKDYIRDKDVTERDVAEFFQLPVYKVRGWIREGRITYKDTGIHAEILSPTKTCKECGIQLPSNSQESLCRSCQELIEATKAYKNKHIVSQEQAEIANTASWVTERYYH